MSGFVYIEWDSAGWPFYEHTRCSDITAFTPGIACIPTDTRSDCKGNKKNKAPKKKQIK